LLVLKIGAPIINPILMAIFFSIIIFHPISWLKKKGVNGVLSILIVVLGLLIVFVGIGGAVTRSIIEFSKTYRHINKSFMILLNHQLLC